MLWPDYVFILHSYLIEDHTTADVHMTCNVTEALENVLFMRARKTTDVFNSTFKDFHM